MTGLDWTTGADGRDRLLSCSADRNAYVWTRDAAGQWKPQLVLLRFKRGATCAQWNAQGTMFAVGSVEGLVAVGHYAAENDWWVCRHLKRAFADTAAVLSLAWHPSGGLVAAGTLLGNVHLLTTSLDGAQARGLSWLDPAVLAAFDAEAMRMEVGTWIHAVAFSASGQAMAWSGHDGVVTVLYPASGRQWSMQPRNSAGLSPPFSQLVFLSEGVLLGVGFDPAPVLMAGGETRAWVVKQTLDPDQVALTKSPSMTPGRSSTEQRKSVFEAGAPRSPDDPKHAPLERKGAHLTTVTGAQRLEGGRVATVGLDGRLVIWSLGRLAAQLEMEAARV